MILRLKFPDELSYEPFMEYLVYDGIEFTIKEDAPEGTKERFETVRELRRKFWDEHKE